MTTGTRRDRRAHERRQARGRREAMAAGGGSGGGSRPSYLVPVIVVGLGLALVLGLRAAGVFEPGPPKLDVSDARFNPAGQAAGVQQKDEGRGHVSATQTVKYGTTPPTSGDHWDTPAPWGSYDKQQPNERTVHNLEHGGIVISYAGLSPDEQKQLTTIVAQLRTTQYRKIVLQPYSGLPDAKVALAAWDWLMKLPVIDETEIVRFVKAHYDGPEAPEPGVP